MNKDYLPHALLCQKAYDDGIRVNDDHSIAVDGPLIAIAGTANIENVGEDMTVLPRLFCGYWVHGGCVTAFEEMEQDILPHVWKQGTTIAGHSLGGGIAQLFGIKYGLQVVTFGSLALYVTPYLPLLNHVRFVNNGDPFPDLPPIYRQDRAAYHLGAGQQRDMDLRYHRIAAYIEELRG